MINPGEFYRSLRSHGIDFFCGVPDSLLKEVLLEINATCEAGSHFICPNEGNAVALAAGHFLASGNLALCYLQNSGLGNAVNPLMSLCHSRVYSIPLLLLIGWRGEPDVTDEPQHLAQGAITPDLLRLLDIPFEIMNASSNFDSLIAETAKIAKSRSAPAAILSTKNTFSPSEVTKRAKSDDNALTLSREDVMRILIESLSGEAAIFCTTGFASRELFQLRQESGKTGKVADFLNVGAMGHVSHIALGYALSQPTKRVICIDGDGSAIMHMGALAAIGSARPSRFTHILLNNGAHDSVGGQPTCGFKIDFPAIARACGYENVHSCSDGASARTTICALLESPGHSFLEVRVKTGHRANLVRPPHEFQLLKEEFCNFS